jgi:hypothetical protein
MEQKAEKFISTRWRIALSLLIGIFTVLETMRFVWRLSFFDIYGWGNMAVHAAIVATTFVLLLLTVLGKQAPPLFIVFIIAFNVMLMVVYPYNISNSGSMLYDSMTRTPQYLFSLPEPVFYVYLLVQALLIASLWQYYFTEYLFREFRKNRRVQSQIEFDRLLREKLDEMEKNKEQTANS